MAASRQFTVNELAELKRDFEESVLDESGSIDKWDLINPLQKHDAYTAASLELLIWLIDI